MWVKITAKGAEETRASMAQVAEDARKLGEMDPTIKIKVDSDAARKLSAVRTEIRALAADGDKGGLRTLAGALRLVAAGAEDARVKARALRLELDALGALKSLEGGGGGPSILGGIPGVGGLLSSSWPAAIGGLIVALAALPFLAQAAAGALTFVLGGAMTALGVYAESGTRSVRYQFAQLVSGKDGIAATLKNISPAFGEALTTILSAARTFIPQFIRDFGPALKAIAGPLKAIGVMLAGTLANPQVAASIKAVGQAFGAILTALTPQIPGDIAAVADGITNIARAISKNPKAIADFISGLIHLIGILLDVIAWLAQVAAYIELHFIPAWHRTERFLDKWRHDIAKTMIAFWHHTTNVFDGVRHDVAHYWDMTWNNTIGRLERGRHDIARQFDQIRHDIAHTWDVIWNNTVGRVKRGVQDVENWFDTLKAKITTKVSGYKTLLLQAGKDLLNGLKNGINAMLPGLLSYVEGVGSSILAHIKSALGIKSPSQVTRYHGQMLAAGLALGMDDGRSAVSAAAMRLAGSAVPAGYGGPGGVLRLEVVGRGGGMLDQLFISWLKNYVRVAGGGGPQSVQRALGQVWR